MLKKYSNIFFLYLQIFFYATLVNPSMIICVVTDANKPNNTPIVKMERSCHLCLLDDKMIQVNENTSQPKKQENKK
jgi:hypothetical protein